MRDLLKRAFLGAAGPLSTVLVAPCRVLGSLPGAWRVPIFAYHQVAETGGAGGYPWTVTPAVFETHLRVLADESCRVTDLENFVTELRQGRVSPRTVVLTFDDGFRGVWLHAYPLLKRYGFPATLFLATGSMGTPRFPWVVPRLRGDEDPDEWRPLRWSEVRDMTGPVLSLGSHTVSHPHLARCAAADMAREVNDSRRHIREETGIDVKLLAYPGGIERYGDHSGETRRILAESGYAGAVVSELGRNGRRVDAFRLRRLGVGVEDSPARFRAKLLGAYDWARALQWAAHRLFPDSSHY